MSSEVRTLPSPEKIGKIHALAEEGFTPHEIRAELFPDEGGHALVAVRNVLDDPDAYDPILDEVAVARALAGERSVWDALTHYERREVMLAVYARRQAERAENDEDAASLRHLRGQANYAAPNAPVPVWLERLSTMLEVPPRLVIDSAKAFAQARVL